VAKERKPLKVIVPAACGGAGTVDLRLHLPPPSTQAHRKDTIVRAEFANSTSDAIFDEALKTALSVSLRQSPFLNVLPDSQVAKTMADLPSAMEVTILMAQRHDSHSRNLILQCRTHSITL